MGYCERPFARVSPPSGGRRAAPLRRKPRCLRARLVCACPACPPLWGFRLLCFMPVAPARARGSSCAYTSCLPTRSGVGALCVRLGACLVGACCGRVCLRVAGFRVYARGVFAFWCLRALVLACLLGVVGQCGPAAPAPLAWLVLTPLVWACWRVRRPPFLGEGVTVMGRDNVVPPHTAWRCPRCVACKRRVGVLSWCANTRARAEREMRGRGDSWGGPWWPGRGLWVVARAGGNTRWWRQVPKAGGSKIDATGAGAWCAPGRGGSFGSGGAWWLRVLVVVLLPLGAGAWCWGRGAFPLVVGWVGGSDFPW